MTNKKTWLKGCLAPTLWVSDTYKKSATSSANRGIRVKRLNKIYFGIALSIWGILFLWGQVAGNMPPLKVVLIFIPLWALSRVNEIFMAFIKDVFDKLDPSRRSKNGLEYFDRIGLALRSFMELTIQYAILYFILDTYYLQYGFHGGLFNQPIESPFTALYVSLITIASVGYGDYVPVHPLARGLVMYEIITGFLLLAVSFTVYVSLDLDEKEAP
ncbi:MAG: ion channel [Niameybacter sp.]